MRHRIGWILVWIGGITVAALSSQKSAAPLADLYRKVTIKLVPVATIDETTLPKDVFFQAVTDVACDPRGNVYVCDYKANHVKKFDAAGRYLKSIGRQGQGPGEFDMPFHIAATANHLFVYDLRNQRLTALTVEGDYKKSIPLIVGAGRPDRMSSLPSGDLVVGWETIFYEDRSRPQEYSIRIYSPELDLRKTVYSRDIWRNKYMEIEGLFTNIIQPFSPLVSWDVTADGKIIVGFQKEYQIEIHDPAQGKIGSFIHSYEPVRVTDKEKEEFFAGMTFGSSQGEMKRGAPPAIIKNTTFPKEKPAFYNILADSEGDILVFPYRSNKEEWGKYFDAFSPEGKYLGSVKIEGSDPFPQTASIRDGAFWAAKHDDEGLVRIVKYKIAN
jgi:hypothetical protein